MKDQAKLIHRNQATKSNEEDIREACTVEIKNGHQFLQGQSDDATENTMHENMIKAYNKSAKTPSSILIQAE